jgi:hypothetical protein
MVSPGPVGTPFWTAPGGFAEIFADAMDTTRDRIVDYVVPTDMGN